MESTHDFHISDVAEILTQHRDKDSRSLITVLEEIQERYRYLPKDALILVSTWMGVPLSQVYSIATFYNAFSLKPKGKHVINICTGTACHVRGSHRVLEHVQRKLGLEPGETSRDGEFTLETVNCLGACALGPVVVMDGKHSGQMNSAKTDRLLENLQNEEEGEEKTANALGGGQ